jgi:hypothetical protein
LARPDIDLERYEAYWWLYKVALREVWALGPRRQREQPIGRLNGVDEDSLEPVDLDSDVPDMVAERIDTAPQRFGSRRSGVRVRPPRFWRQIGGRPRFAQRLAP